jgi:hypothetical protein
VNGKTCDISRYWQLHEQRFRYSIEAFRHYATGRVLEIGGHPWAMTSLIAAEPGLSLSATVSAEEMTHWPDNIGVNQTECELITPEGLKCRFWNYSLNIERTLVDLEEPVDAVFACEVIEHLVRAPHIMMLNINRWLNLRGRVLVTTPNGLQFVNPFRNKNARPAFRCYCYERHNGTFTLEQLEDLIGRCGFAILESGYWNLYPRRPGLSSIYDALGKSPIPYLRAKFARTIFVIAEKVEDCEAARGFPKAYEPHSDWENIVPA